MKQPSRADTALESLGLLALGLGLIAGVVLEVVLIPFLFAAKWGRALARRLRANRPPAWKEDAWLRRD